MLSGWWFEPFEKTFKIKDVKFAHLIHSKVIKPASDITNGQLCNILEQVADLCNKELLTFRYLNVDV